MNIYIYVYVQSFRKWVGRSETLQQDYKNTFVQLCNVTNFLSQVWRGRSKYRFSVWTSFRVREEAVCHWCRGGNHIAEFVASGISTYSVWWMKSKLQWWIVFKMELIPASYTQFIRSKLVIIVGQWMLSAKRRSRQWQLPSLSGKSREKVGDSKP